VIPRRAMAAENADPLCTTAQNGLTYSTRYLSPLLISVTALASSGCTSLITRDVHTLSLILVIGDHTSLSGVNPSRRARRASPAVS
jgi:hypothetical protein